MQSFYSIFNSREQALIIWLLAIIIWSFSSDKMRPRAISLIKAFFAPKVILVLVVCWIYISIILIFANKIGWWNQSMLKDSIVWMFMVIVLIMKVVSKGSKTSSLLEIFKDVVQPIVIAEFIINLNTFGLFWELLLLPLITFIYILTLFGQRNPEHAIVVKFFNFLLACWGLYIITWSIYQVVINFNQTDKHQEGLNFFHPIWLTIAFLPCLYGVMMYSRYDDNRAGRKIRNMRNKL